MTVGRIMLFVSLIFSLCITSFADTNIRISGILQVFTDNGPKGTNTENLRIKLAVEEGNPDAISFDEEVETSKNFRWMSTGTLFRNETIKIRVYVAEIPEEYVLWSSPLVEVSVTRPRIQNLHVVIKTPRKTARDCFDLANELIQRLEPLGPSKRNLVRFQNALDYYDKALKYWPNPVFQFEKATVLHKVRDYDGCSREYETLVEISRDVPNIVMEIKGWFGQISCLKGTMEKWPRSDVANKIVSVCSQALDRGCRQCAPICR